MKEKVQYLPYVDDGVLLKRDPDLELLSFRYTEAKKLFIGTRFNS
jgi:hypothetical protein